jgi:hypothetical protein
MAMDETRFAATLADLITDCENYREERSADRIQAMNYYDGKMNDVPSEEGRSRVVSRDVRAAIKKVLPSVVRTILGNDKVVEFEPVAEGDEGKAEQATDYMNYVVLPESDGREAIQDAMHDALLLRNGVIRWWHDERQIIKVTNHTGLDDMAFAQLVAADDVEVLEHSPRLETIQQVDPMTGQPMQMQVPVHDVKIKRAEPVRKIRLAAVPLEKFLIHPDAIDLDDALLVGMSERLRRADLVAMGYDRATIDALPEASTDLEAEEERLQRRREYAEEVVTERMLQEVDYYEVYVRIDKDDDGIAELRRVVMAGGTGQENILEDEYWDDVPFADIACERRPHQWEGASVADDVTEIQRVKTVLLRQTLDNLYWQNMAQPAVQEGAIENPESVLNPQFGLPIRIKRGVNVADALQYNRVPFFAEQSFSMLGYLDNEMADRTGINDASSGMAPDALQNTTAKASAMIEAAGIGQTELIVRTLAHGLKRVFKGLLRLTIQHQDKPRSVRLKGKWVQFDPRSWDANMDATVNVGLGAGTRERDMMMMGQIIGLQEKLVAVLGSDNPFVQPDNVHRALVGMTMAAGIKSPDMYFSAPDPQDIERRKQEARQKPTPEQEKAQAAMQIEQMKAQLAMQMKQADMEVQTNKERAQMDADLQIKAAEMEKDAVARREQLEADAIKEEQKANLAREQMAQARELKLLELAQQRELAIMSKGGEETDTGEFVPLGTGAVQQVINAVQMLAEQVQGIGARDSAPRRVVRDPQTNDIIGVEVEGGSARRVVRDPMTGDIIGVETVQ